MLWNIAPYCPGEQCGHVLSLPEVFQIKQSHLSNYILCIPNTPNLSEVDHVQACNIQMHNCLRLAGIIDYTHTQDMLIMDNMDGERI